MTICYRVSQKSPIDSIPLGKACANTAALLINDNMTLAHSGEIAEIHARGSCLALGYYKDPEKTQPAFIQNPLHTHFPDIIYKTGELGEGRDGGSIDETAYRRYITENLSLYMVPTRFVKLDAMPFNANRKKDRPLLVECYFEVEE